MIRGDLLRAKSEHVAAEHHREVVALAKVHARDADARARVRGHEDRFWREVARASKAPAGRSSSSNRNERALALNRAMEAHGALSKAKCVRREVAGEIQGQVTRVLKAKYAVSAFEKLRIKERAARAHKIAERCAEQGDEVALLRRAVSVSWRRDPSRLSGAREDTERCRSADPKPVSPWQTHGTEIPQSRIDPPSEGSKGTRVCADMRAPQLAAVSVEEVHGKARDEGVALRVRMESAGGSLSCRLENTSSGGVGVLVEAPACTLASSLERERRSVASRLAQVGVKIDGFEIRRDPGNNGALSGFLRRRRPQHEEGDENVIA